MEGLARGHFTVEECDYRNQLRLTFDNCGQIDGRPRMRYFEQFETRVDAAAMVRKLRKLADDIALGEACV